LLLLFFFIGNPPFGFSLCAALQKKPFLPTNNSLYFRSVLNRLLNEQVIQNHCNNKTFQKQITFQHKLALKTNSFRLSISLKRNESLMTGTKAIFQQFSHFFFGSIKDSSVFMALERNLEAVVPLKEEDLVREP
jgi:hypothetical protein